MTMPTRDLIIRVFLFQFNNNNNNRFQTKTRSSISELYNEVSVLENMHCCEAFKVLFGMKESFLSYLGNKATVLASEALRFYFIIFSGI